MATGWMTERRKMVRMRYRWGGRSDFFAGLQGPHCGLEALVLVPGPTVLGLVEHVGESTCCGRRKHFSKELVETDGI